MVSNESYSPVAITPSVFIDVMRNLITTCTPNPIAATKVFGEMLGSLYAYKHGLEIFLIRIGHATPTPSDFRDLAMWISPRDLAQLVSIGIDHPNVHFEIVYGVSGNTRSWYDNSNAQRLGYRPLDNAESYAAAVLTQKGSVTERHYQGGSYTQID